MREWAEELVARSRAEGVDLVGAGGLLTSLSGRFADRDGGRVGRP